MSICEITLELFKKTNYTSHSSYCNSLKMAIKDDKLSSRDKDHLIHISNVLVIIYSFTSEEIGEYICEYLESEAYLVFEKPVKLTQEFFPFSGNW